MLFRIQSLWLLLAAAATSVMLFFPVYQGTTAAGEITKLMVGSQLLMLIITFVLMVVPLVIIFMYKNRKNQKWLIFLMILLNLVFLALILIRANDFQGQNDFKSSTYHLGALMPVVAVILLLMARTGIKADEKLIKDAERLR